MSWPARLAIVAMGALVTHFALLATLPSAIMTALIVGLGESAGTNTLYRSPRPDAANQRVVRPSPDLAYSMCAFDLRDGAIEVFAPIGDDYASVSAYARSSDNFFARNDREAKESGADAVHAVLFSTEAGEPAAIPEGATLVEAPSERGIVLVRRVIRDDEHYAQMDGVRRASYCRPLMSSAPRGGPG